MNLDLSPVSPYSILANSDEPFRSTLGNKYRINTKDSITDIATLTDERLEEVLTVLHKLYSDIESSTCIKSKKDAR